MSTMVERVARTICREQGFREDARSQKGLIDVAEGLPGFPCERWRDFCDVAVAVLVAMRDPTDAITKDGMIRLAVLRNGTEASREEAATVWRAMIDATMVGWGRR